MADDEASTSPSSDGWDVEKLVRILKPVVYEDVAARQELQRAGINVTRSDYYSEIPTVDDIMAPYQGPDLRRIFPSDVEMFAFIASLQEFTEEFNPPVEEVTPGEYFWNNNVFSFSDAMVYYAIIRKTRPQMVLEIGSGFSTLVAAEALRRNGSGRLVCVEPYPRDFLLEMNEIELIQERIQDIDLAALTERFSDNDILFVDSTHTVRHGSDVLNIYLDLLPRITASINVHVHDVYLPYPLPSNFMLEHQIFWGEQYLLYAYLLGNSRLKVLYGSHYLWREHPHWLESLMHGRFTSGGASFWFAIGQ